MRRRTLVSTILALIIVLVAGPRPLQAQEATPAAEEASLLDAYGQAWSSGDASRVAALYAEDAVREDVPTGITSRGRAAIEVFATGLFETDADVRLEVTDGFVGETWAVIEWTYSGVHQATGGEVTFRGASVLELEGSLIREESDYYDLPQMQQQIAAAGGTPAALETPAEAAEAASGTGAAAEQAGSVTVRVYSCPAGLSQEEHDQLAALLAACTPLEAPEVAPTLIDLAAADGEPVAGTATEPGVYQWQDVAFGDYAVGGSSDEMPADLAGMRMMDASGATLQNPVLRLDESSPQAEFHAFYFLAE